MQNIGELVRTVTATRPESDLLNGEHRLCCCPICAGHMPKDPARGKR